MTPREYIADISAGFATNRAAQMLALAIIVIGVIAWWTT